MTRTPPLIHKAKHGTRTKPRCGKKDLTGDRVSNCPGEENCIHCVYGLEYGQVTHHHGDPGPTATCGSEGAGEVHYHGDWSDAITCEACWEKAPEHEKEYRFQRRHERHPDHCPVCMSDQTDGESVDIQGSRAVQECGCNDCGAAWYDEYQLDRYRLINYGDSDDE